MIPSPWQLVLLTLAAYRVVRLIGWDDWPPVLRARAWLIGETWVSAHLEFREHELSEADDARLRKAGFTQEDFPTPEVSLPGKTPGSEVEAVRPSYSRPTLAHLIHCPWCLGWWVSLIGWIAWLIVGYNLLYVAVPLAVSSAIGFLARNLDP